MRWILILVVVMQSYAIAQEVIFFKEDITFQISEENFRVEGYYWFYNLINTNIEKLIYFPFGGDNLHESNDFLEVFNVTEGTAQNVLDKTSDGFYFVLNLRGGDTTTIRIVYQYNIKSDSVMYVLRSTQHWQNPLQSAEYKLRIDKRRDVTRFSIVPDTVYAVENENIYYWKRINYMPQTDFVFHFSPP